MKGWLRPRRVAQYLDCTREHIYNLVARGELQAIRLGPRDIRISELSLQGFVDKHRVESTEKD
jgi:excisionase family DNA binding protein